MGNEDLGIHLEAIGDLANAAEAYGRMRQDTSTSKQIIDVGKHLVSVFVQRREWQMVIANLNKMMSVEDVDQKSIQPFVKIMHGVALLGQGKYPEAAQSFLQAEAGAPSELFNEFVSSNDVAIYGGLVSLATMDRRDLQKKVLENKDFRSFLELEPHLRRAITQYVGGRYSACLATLDSYRPDYLLDIHLQKHVPALYAQIRSKCIVQYLIPFSCVTLESMNAAFAPPGENIEDELITMIRSGILKARIDTVNKVSSGMVRSKWRRRKPQLIRNHR
jgi:COP9 signalosome complex subunit 1